MRRTLNLIPPEFANEDLVNEVVDIEIERFYRALTDKGLEVLQVISSSFSGYIEMMDMACDSIKQTRNGIRGD